MKRLGLGILAVGLISVAALLLVRSSKTARSSEDFPDGAAWLCAGCGHGFATSIEAVAEWLNEHPGEGMPCPKCKKPNATRAFHCPLSACRKFSLKTPVSENGRRVCPECRQPLP